MASVYKASAAEKQAEADAREARIQLLISRKNAKLDLFTGKPITAEDLVVISIEEEEENDDE